MLINETSVKKKHPLINDSGMILRPDWPVFFHQGAISVKKDQKPKNCLDIPRKINDSRQK